MSTKLKYPYQYSIYKLECGHSQEIKKQHYKAGKYKCNTCMFLKHKEEAVNSGLELLEDKPSSYKRYKFISCGHEKLITPDQVRTKNVECKECKLENLDSILKSLNIEIVSRVKNSCEIKNLGCGHIIKTKYSNILKNYLPKCSICSFELDVEVAKSKGLELLEKNYNDDQASYFYRLPCGCVKSLRTGNVKRGVWACDIHSNWWNKPSGVYVVKLEFKDFTCIKLGVSTDLNCRISSYGFKEDCKVTTLIYKDFDTYKNAILIEKKLHSKFKNSNIDNDAMKLKMKSGFTECYPVELSFNILKELESYE